MSFVLLDAALLEAIHDEVPDPGVLPGRARDQSLASALARVENRLAYGLIGDAFDLAAMYAVAVATRHCFHVANKRTAFRTMNAALAMNGVRMEWDLDEVGPLIVEVAQGRVSEDGLGAWLRGKAGG